MGRFRNTRDFTRVVSPDPNSFFTELDAPLSKDPIRHIQSHTSLRGIAAAFVVFGHYTAVFGRDVAGMDFYRPHTHLGVDLFFLLSGFVLAYVYKDTFSTGVSAGSWGQFMIRRLARIYPLHIATLIIVLSYAHFTLAPGTAKVLAMNIGLVHAWGLTDQFLFNSPSWSISCEFAAYLVFPFLMLVMQSFWGRIALLGMAFGSYGLLWSFGAGSLDLDAIGRTHALWRAVAAFPLGMLLAWAHLQSDGPRGVWQLLGLAGLIGAIVIGLPEITWMPFLALLVFATAHDDGPLAPMLRQPAFVGLGEVSYGVYLLQWPVMVLMFKIRPKLGLDGVALEIAALGIFLGLLFICSLVSYKCFEQPILQLFRRKTQKIAH